MSTFFDTYFWEIIGVATLLSPFLHMYFYINGGDASGHVEENDDDLASMNDFLENISRGVDKHDVTKNF